MKYYLKNVGWVLLALGITLMLFDFLLDNSLSILIVGLVVVGISYVLK